MGFVASAAIVVASSPVVQAAGDLVFGAVHRLNRQPQALRTLNGISCPSLKLCAAVDSDGEVVTSSDLTRDRPAWSVARVDVASGPGGGSDGVYLNAISCPRVTFCIAVDSSGRAAYSSEPTSGRVAWTVAEIDGSNNIRGISCPTTRLCVAVDDSGNVITSTSPTRTNASWTVTHIPATRHLTGISCPTPHLCVATAHAPRGGNLVISTNPTGGQRAWAILTQVSPHGFESVSCPSVHLCVATDLGGFVTSTTRPLGGRKAWTSAHIDPSPSSRTAGFIISAVACRSATFCIAVDDVGKAFWSTHPGAGLEAWSMTQRPDTTEAFRGVACPSLRLCIGIGENALLSIRRPT
jgi:hypothetical protein